MAELNYFNLSNVFGKLAVADITTVNKTILSNSINSNCLIRLNTILLCNVSNSTNGFANVSITSASNTRVVSVLRKIQNNTTEKLIKRDTAFYMQEGDSLIMQANANSILQAIVSYEILK
jgi:hypothetical protein